MLLACAFALVTARVPGVARAWTANGPLLPNGSATGSGTASTVTGPPAWVSVTLTGARPNTVYAIYSCIPMLPGTFDCVGRNNPPNLQQVTVYPRAIAPVAVTLAQQDYLTTDGNGNASRAVVLQGALYPDTPASIYNVVQLIDVNDPSDSYTSVMLQTPPPPVATGANAVPQVGVTLALGQPVFVFAAYPGYAFPVAFFTSPLAPFVPFFTVPPGVIGGPPLVFQQGVCPNGQPPVAYNNGAGVITFVCP
jgi:hypothetical protein